MRFRMKFMLTHCYTDSNKGDAGIIIATTQLIRDSVENPEINFMSTYSEHDSQYETEHNIIKEYAENTYPNIFGEPLKLKGFGELSRIFSFIFGFLKGMLLLISCDRRFISLFFSRKECEGVKKFLESDVIISKGGSFLYSEDNSVRQSLSLIRMLYPFWLAKRYNKNMYIFSQSLGPINGSFNKFLFKKSLNKVKHIYLRESLCLDKFSEVKEVSEMVGHSIIPDSAFYMREEVGSKSSGINIINRNEFNIGMTIVDHDFKYIRCNLERENKRKNYKDSIIKFIEYAHENYNAHINIFSQVRALNSHLGHSDIIISKEIENHFSTSPISVVYHNDNWTPLELRALYEKMDIFIGTRLHSAIFSLSVTTPVINIAYHGTKSQGIFSNIPGFENYVIDINNISSDDIILKFEDIIKNKSELESSIAQNVDKIRADLLSAMHSVCH